MNRSVVRVVCVLVCVVAGAAGAQEATYRLYDDLAAFVSNPEGKDFTLTLNVGDINHVARGPSELLLKIYDPDGRAIVREVIPDDGVDARNSGPVLPGWDHEAWYYETCYSRGLDPTVRWSSFSDPARLAAMARRTFTYQVKAAQKGVYRVSLAGSPDLYVTLSFDPALPFGVSGGPDWMHGHGDIHRRRFICVPKGAVGIALGLLELDMPRSRRATLSTLDGKMLAWTAVIGKGETARKVPVQMTVDASRGYARCTGTFETPGQFDDQVLVLEVSDGPGDYFLKAELVFPKEQRNWRGQPAVPAVLCPDEATARALRNGAIYHDGRLFWQMYQVRLYDWLQTLKPEDFRIPEGLPTRPGFISVGSHQSPMQFLKNKDLRDPKPGTADIIMHSYELHKNRQALNVALQEMLEGMLLIGPNDHVMHGGNLAYEMGTYSYFYHRPAWRILQQSDAPEEAKGPVREFIIQVGDRLALCRGIELVNGNSLSSLVQGMRYCSEASGDPLQKQLFDTYWQRFTTGGFGDRIGVGPSGGVQEGFGYDHHYGAYVLSGWRAVLADLKDERFQKVYNGVLNLYSHVSSQGENAAPWGSRTHIKPTRYDPGMEGPYRWKGVGGPDFTASVNNADEFFAARRKNYYVVTYHGRITPTWLGEGFHGQIGYSGGILCQLHIPGKGQVLASTLNGDYGGGMHVSQWRNFHIHSIVGQTADGQPLVSANSEHFNARLEGNTVTGSGEVRQSSVRVSRSYTFGADDITCSVKLGEADAERIFAIYGGAHGLRGNVTEAYEMIPFTWVTAPGGRGKPPIVKTAVTALDADGKTIAPVSTKPVRAAAVLIDQGGYGVRIDLDAPRPVLLGERNTVLITLVGRAGASQREAAAETPGPEAEAPAADEPAAEEGAEGGQGMAAVKAVPAGSVSLAYRLMPYADQPPAGPVQPVDAAAAAAAAPGSPVAPPAPGAAPRPAQPAAAVEHKLAVLPAVDSADKVEAALAGQQAFTVKLKDAALAELRFAVAGDNLALDAEVFDKKPTQADVPWRASCIEVFGSTPGAMAIGQVFLVPQVGDAPAKAYRAQANKQVPAPDVRLQSTVTKDGYSLQALIPLPLLALDGSKDRMLLEFQTTVFGPADAKGKRPVERSTLFGSALAYMDVRNYGVFRLENETGRKE